MKSIKANVKKRLNCKI